MSSDLGYAYFYEFPENLKQTDAQRLADVMFLESMERDFVHPLVEELKSQVDGFEDIPTRLGGYDRMMSAVKLNEPYFGVGDYLPLCHALVYAGRELGHTVPLFSSRNQVAVNQYQPRFKAGVLGRQTVFYSEGGEDNERTSDIGRFLNEERETYDSLPPAFKAALLCQHVESRIIADMHSIIDFVFGTCSAENLVTWRIWIDPTVGQSGNYNGFVVRIRDVNPSTKFGVSLAQVLRNYRKRQDKIGTPPFEQQETDSKPKTRRKPDPKTETACTYIYELEQQGVIIDKRRGGLGYKKIIADMELKLGDKVRHYDDPDTLGRVYRAWKKKNGLD